MKKKVIIISGIMMCAVIAFAQNHTDALRYSTLNGIGSARYVGVGGAFSSLGGDFSSISDNPAGLGVYRSSEFSFSPSLSIVNSQSTYLGNREKDYDLGVNLGNLGYVGTIVSNGDDSPLKSVSFGIGYNNISNFRDIYEIEGKNLETSITDNIAARAFGVNDANDLEKFYQLPAWNSYLIDYDPDNNKAYKSNLESRGATQMLNITNRGRIDEWVFSAGANIDHRVYVGASFGIHDLDFNQNKFYKEVDKDNEINNFNKLGIDENLTVSGTGYNFKVGVIVRPIDWMRIGASVHTPTFYSVSEDYSTTFISDLDTNNYVANSPTGFFSYRLMTPFRAVGGLSFIIAKQGVVSLDYQFVDYSMAKFKSNSYDFNNENDNIEEFYKPSHIFKIGTEWKFGPIAVRAGYNYCTSPYNSNHVNSASDSYKISGGIGYRIKTFFIDFGYEYLAQTEKYFMYEGFGVDAPVADINKVRHTLVSTIGFRF